MEPTLSVTLTQGNGGWRNFWTNYMYDFLHDKWSVSPIALSVILRCNLSTFPVEWIQIRSDGINFDKLPNCHQLINEMSRLKLEYTIFRHFSGHWRNVDVSVCIGLQMYWWVKGVFEPNISILNRSVYCYVCVTVFVTLFIKEIFQSGFSQTHNIGNNANIGFKGFTTWKQKKSSDKMLPPVPIEPGPLMNQHSPFWTNWAFACKTETLGSFCHTLLIPTKWSMSKN